MSNPRSVSQAVAAIGSAAKGIIQLVSRSALEWVLDQYKERKPRDSIIAEWFNTYRFADHKERVIDLLGCVCAVSTFTTAIVYDLKCRSSVSET